MRDLESWSQRARILRQVASHGVARRVPPFLGPGGAGAIPAAVLEGSVHKLCLTRNSVAPSGSDF